MKRQTGFSLVELMIVVAVVAILAGIAIPSYSAYVKRAERAEARAALLDMAQKQERYFSSNNTYLAITTSTPPTGWVNYTGGSSSGTRKYDITATLTGGGTGYIASAAPSTGHSDADCGTFTMTHQNVRSNTGNAKPTAECWRK